MFTHGCAMYNCTLWSQYLQCLLLRLFIKLKIFTTLKIFTYGCTSFCPHWGWSHNSPQCQTPVTCLRILPSQQIRYIILILISQSRRVWVNIVLQRCNVLPVQSLGTDHPGKSELFFISVNEKELIRQRLRLLSQRKGDTYISYWIQDS